MPCPSYSDDGKLRSLRFFGPVLAGGEETLRPVTCGTGEGGGTPRRLRIQDWFDPNDDQHLLAYEHFQETGRWPARFLPAGVEFPPAWAFEVAFRLAQRWLRHKADVRQRSEGAE